ncbi:hypothetical protein FACS1894190_04330 [Spirochaetia bacterium]|nr:hypothetical protein FACS1894190_04330 [Spirochaetia bacterium]
MDIHNIIEDIVIAQLKKACADIERENGKHGICTCAQCRLDAACYVLNRLEPRYIVSSRGLVREDQFNLDKQQKIADITALIYIALKQVGHNQRPNFDHGKNEIAKGAAQAYFNFPAIIGRLFNGQNFTPMNDIDVTLFADGKPVAMKDANWPNPCRIMGKTEGAYTFWPKNIPAKKVEEHSSFTFEIKAEADGLLPLSHVFEIPVISENSEKEAVSMERTYKISDLYMFAPEKEYTRCFNLN